MKKIIALLIVAVFSTASFAQIIKYIDLADGPIKITEPIEDGKDVVIKILNRSKVNTYEIIINRLAPIIPPLESTVTGNTIAAVPNPCQELEGIYNDILGEANESKISALRRDLNKLINTTSPACPTRSKAILLDRELDLSYNITSLKKGEVLEITVKRITPSPQTWMATYNTGSKGVWKTSYGFAFMPNWFAKEKKYFLDSVNKITPETNSKNMDYAPCIFFNWFPGKQSLNAFSYGLSGGLGINFEAEPVIFLGGSATYHHNISINIGLVAYRQSFLKGRYKVGEIINENNFDEESGLHQKLFRVNPCIAISFRFGQNPFRTNEE
jgi:hypothetical protein